MEREIGGGFYANKVASLHKPVDLIRAFQIGEIMSPRGGLLTIHRGSGSPEALPCPLRRMESQEADQGRNED